MASTGQYQGSQAFNNINPLMKESVNPNTGSVNFSVPLVKLQGKRSSIDLTVNLFYSAGFRGTFGLPKNWGLDLPYVLDGKSVTANGRTYAIDPTWTDVRGHASGLRYTNNHGIKFESVVPPEKLPSGQPGEYGYILEHVDGSIDYFDTLGKPVEHHDIYGNYLHYNYVTGDQEGPGSPTLRLDYILDSWGQKIQFAYEQGFEMRITLPDGGETLVKFSDVGIHAIVDAARNKTEMEYAPFNDGPNILSRIQYPSGLISRYDYVPIQYLNSEGSPQYFPAVEDFRYIDSENNIYQHTRYMYGRESTQTYTGAAIGCRVGGSADSLMDSDGPAMEYKYDVTTLSMDRDEKPVAQTLTWFNNLHLPIEETRYLLNDQGHFVEAFRTLLTYNVDKEKRARITSYNLPTSTENFRNVSSQNDPNWQPMTRTDSEYNEYGNPLETTEWFHVEGGGYTKQNSLKTEYSTTVKKVQLPAKSWDTDEISHTLEYKEHKPSEDGRSIASAAIWFQDNLEPGARLQPWREISLKYDAFGRLIGMTTAWSAGAPRPDGSLASVTTKTEYADLHDGILSKTEIDAGGNRTMIQQDMRQTNGPEIKKTLPREQTEFFQYDPIGRLVKHTDALGHQTTTVYTASPKGTSKITKSPQLYCTKTSFDVLEREVQVSDNGDPTISFTDEPSRVLSRKTYNTVAQVQDSTDSLGLTTKFTYDALNRPLTATDAHGNIISQKYENGGLKVTEAINGDVRKVTELDTLLRPLREIKYPDTGDTSAAFSFVQNSAYNGKAKVMEKSLLQMPKTASGTEASTLIKTEKTRYGPGGVVISQTVTGHTEHGSDSVSRQYVLDLFDNNTTYVKQTSYAGGKTYSHQGPTRIYNENNQLAIHRDQEGKEERSFCDENGWLRKNVQCDNTEVTYICDDAGRTIRVAYPSSTSENTFDAAGKLLQTRDATGVIKYSYSLDGTSTGLAYSDGRTQSITLDKFSRTVQETDALGVTKKTEFNSVGLVNLRSCQGDTVTYIYGTANHTHGQQLGSSLSGSSNYQSKLTYDGFGRLRQNTVQDSTSAILLETTYQLDAHERVKSLKSTSAVFAEHNNERKFSYDGIGQVIEETYTGPGPSVTKYAYDGNANVLSVDTDGQVTSMAYNKIDQRIESGFEYDANGRLVQDNEGRKYSFDERDNLLSVSPASDSTTKFDYRSDSSLSHRQVGDLDNATFYHDSNKINAVHTTKTDGIASNAKTSLLSDSDSILAGYTDGQSTSYFLHQLGSTSLVKSPTTHKSARYNAYGLNKTPSSPGNILSSFGFTQAFTDEKSGLVYLGSRFYNPKQMSFLSRDTYHTENRYAYCEGDPINRIDPSGHSWVDYLATAVGIGVTLGVGAAITALTAGTATPLFAAALGGVLSGALGSAASLGIQDMWGDTKVTGMDYLVGIGTGALIGGLSAGMGYTAQLHAGGSFVRAVTNGAATGAIVSITEESIKIGMAVYKEEELHLGRSALNVVKGAALGAATGYWARRTYIRNQAVAV